MEEYIIDIDPEQVSEQFTKRARWVAWTTEVRDGKPKKPPVVANSAHRKFGQYADITDPTCLTSFDEALKYLEVRDGLEGIGFALSDDDGLVVLDIDDCLTPDGRLDPAVWEFVKQQDSYTEWSPSREGIHILCHSDLTGIHDYRVGEVEVKGIFSKGYATVTGNRVEGTGVEVRALMASASPQVEAGGDGDGEIASTSSPTPRDLEPTPSAHPYGLVPHKSSLSDEEFVWLNKNPQTKLQKRFRISKELLRGDGNFPSDSERDYALAQCLMWQCHGDEERANELFHKSGCMRPKWDRKWDDGTYGTRTLQRAYASLRTQFDPDDAHIALLAAQIPKDPKVTGGDATSEVADEEPVKGHFARLLDFGEPPPGFTFDPMKLTDDPLRRPIKDLMQESYKADDLGNAEVAMRLFGDQLLYRVSGKSGKGGEWMCYHDGYWHPSPNGVRWAVGTALRCRQHAVVGEGKDKAAVLRAASPSEWHIRACVSIMSDLNVRQHVTPADFDKDPYKLNVKNGVLDLRTGELVGHDRSQRFTYCVNVPYEPDADRTEWLAFLRECVRLEYDEEGAGCERPDDEVVELLEFIQQAVGYSLTGSTREDRMFHLWGITRGGKGLFLETLRAVFKGTPVVHAANIENLGPDHKFAMARHHATRMIQITESTKKDRISASWLKKIAGGAWLEAEHKYKDPFEFKPQFQIWLESNVPIVLDAQDDAAWTRPHVIPFTQSFLGREDKTMKERFLDPAFLVGVLAWMVEGAQGWYADPDGLQSPEVVRAATEASRAQQDSIRGFIKECITFEEGKWTPVRDVNEAYRDWCKEADMRPEGRPGAALKRAGFPDSTGRRIDTRKTKVYEGVALGVITDASLERMGGMIVNPDA